MDAYLAEPKNQRLTTELTIDLENFPDDEYWIGLHRSANDQPWMWSHSFTMLNDQESDWIATREPPSHGYQFCAVVWLAPVVRPGTRGSWLSSTCYRNYRAICEYQPR